MVRSILFQKPINIKYERDGVKFIGMMAIVGVIGFIFSIVISIYECLTIPATILKSLDLGKVTDDILCYIDFLSKCVAMNWNSYMRNTLCGILYADNRNVTI